MTKHNTRTGKIARLSHDIREQLNSRFREGEPAQTILDWLNAIPSVQAVLNSQFDGHPISEQNLSSLLGLDQTPRDQRKAPPKSRRRHPHGNTPEARKGTESHVI